MLHLIVPSSSAGLLSAVFDCNGKRPVVAS